MYPKSFIEELKNAIPISEVVGRKLRLRRSGRDFIALCPFHHEKTPSFSVSDSRGIYHCFGCGKTGNIFTFIMESEGMSFREAVEYLANTYGILLPKTEKKAVVDSEFEEIEEIFKINEDSCKFFEHNLRQFYGKNALDYITNRGLNLDNITKFRIGFAQDGFSSLLEYLKKCGYHEDMIEKSGVIAKSDSGTYYDKFRNRVMFPVLNKSGKVIAFTGRILGDGMPKYMNSPETKIYIKGNTLFNYYFAKRAIYDKKFVILVEGNMDTISLFVNGIENVVAPMGTGITERQVKELWSVTNNIFVCFDGDSAGQKASERLSRLALPMLSSDRQMNIVFLPHNVDPDDFVRKNGAIEFNNLLKDAMPLSDYLWDCEVRNLNIEENNEVIPEKKAQLEIALLELTKQIADNTLRGHFIRFYKNKLWSLGRKNSAKKLPATQLRYSKSNVSLIEKKEKKICYILHKFPSLADRLLKEYKIDIFSADFINGDCNCFLNLMEQGFDAQIAWSDDNVDNLAETSALDMINILLLEKEKIALEDDLKKISVAGDIAKIKQISDEIMNVNKKINFFLVKGDFV